MFFITAVQLLRFYSNTLNIEHKIRMENPKYGGNSGQAYQRHPILVSCFQSGVGITTGSYTIFFFFFNQQSCSCRSSDDSSSDWNIDGSLSWPGTTHPEQSISRLTYRTLPHPHIIHQQCNSDSRYSYRTTHYSLITTLKNPLSSLLRRQIYALPSISENLPQHPPQPLSTTPKSNANLNAIPPHAMHKIQIPLQLNATQANALESTNLKTAYT